MKFDDREKAAILAGLRLLQAAQDYTLPWRLHPARVSRGRLSEIEGIFTDDDNLICLYTPEIDKLCERINVPQVRPNVLRIRESINVLRGQANILHRRADACKWLGLSELGEIMYDAIKGMREVADEIGRYLGTTT